ncbi:unnamed protein product [Candidula unifasciata]|uniref:Uncharacterized protein n=1 Tax=Candidula unifasciata TaxID=100452 RepID=A0A8S3ZVU6_9EUPU|nr:unnamed protein product [Candidula unifasciata]
METLSRPGVNGKCEVEVSYGGEADLHKHWTRCEKNPGHLRFTPVDEFNVNCVPSSYQSNDLVDYVRALSDVTVRVDAGYVSEARPETFPGSDQLYPFYSNKGSIMLRVGSGWVSWVENHVPVRSAVCTCKHCRQQGTHIEAAYIHITTAAHVVFDELEAAQTRCYLFFDRGGTPAVCETAVRLTRTSSFKNDVKQDWCEMTYMTFDLALADKLDKILTRLQDLQETLVHKFRPYMGFKASLVPPYDGPITSPKETLAIIVSHPHGCSKQVSIGHCTYLSIAEGEWTKYTYTTATCPGSSGAPVFVLGRGSRWWWWFTHAHCGNCEHNKDLNYSTHNPSGIRFLCPDNNKVVNKTKLPCRSKKN